MAEPYLEYTATLYLGLGDKFVLGTDADGLGLVELRYVPDDGPAHAAIVIDAASAKALAHALLSIIELNPEDGASPARLQKENHA